jgi:hypothetical protein
MLAEQHLDVVLEILPSVHHESLRKSLLAYLERLLPGREGTIVDRLLTFDLDAARPILRIFANARTPQGIEALRRLSTSVNAGLRCESIALLAQNPDQLNDELGKLLQAPQADLRFAALRTMAFHQVRAAGPLLVRRIQEETFHGLPNEEKKELLGALFTLNPSRGESLAIEILNKHGLLSTDEAQEGTRAISAELLGVHGSTMDALNALLGATKRRWWNSQTLRDQAQMAAESIAGRLGKKITAAGELM